MEDRIIPKACKTRFCMRKNSINELNWALKNKHILMVAVDIVYLLVKQMTELIILYHEYSDKKKTAINKPIV